MAAAMCKCSVTHGDKNVVVPFVGPWKRAQLFEYLKRERTLAGIDFGNASLTVFDEDFGLPVEVTDDFIIADKLKLEIKEGSQYRISALNGFQEGGGRCFVLRLQAVLTLPESCTTASLDCLRLIVGTTWVHVTSAARLGLSKEHLWPFVVILAAVVAREPKIYPTSIPKSS
ncbi:hypothetical protein HPB50_016685 [Hyalomma asiaticum]|uniref:Uncharacterized protein n=1 Tax=Hyalomma asiaticum TaxID=266040 RepID=A0ACB7SIH7_HYAAI|nr:hypothetical protein HPB50_016685 [Hyalomma asiaticum]